MMAIPPMSSAMARVRRKTRRPAGRRRPEEGEHADDEGDVGGDGDAPAVDAVAAQVHEGEDGGRDDHAAGGGDDGEGGAAGVAQFADDELALDLHANDEEEDDHEGVVHPALEVLVDGEELAEEGDAELEVGGPRPGGRSRRGRSPRRGR